MKERFATGCRSVVMPLAVVILMNPAVFGQEERPAYIPPSCAGKPLLKMAKEEMMAAARPVPKPNPPVSPVNQLKLFDELARIIKEVYLYPDFHGLDWPSIEREFRGKVGAGMGTEEFYSSMEQFVRRLGDEHSYYESPAIAKATGIQLAGSNQFVGVGALFVTMVETKQVTTLAVIPGSPADHSGLQQHDIILLVDDIPLVQHDTTYPLTRGRECTMASLTVRSPGKEPRKINMVRARVTAPLPVYARIIPATDGRRIGYLFLPTFFDRSIPTQVKKALEDFGPLDGLVIDNRMNGGGSSDVVNPVLGFFTSGTIGHFVSRTARRPLQITATPVHNSQQVPLVILVSKNTVSYAEVFAGVLKDLGRAKIVGQSTAGRVETLHGYIFSDSSKAWIAQERFEPVNDPAGWQGRGVQPDAEAHANWDTFTFETDPALVVALKLLKRK